MHMGKCFAKRGMNDMAAGTLQKALGKKEVMDDEKMLQGIIGAID